MHTQSFGRPCGGSHALTLHTIQEIGNTSGMVPFGDFNLKLLYHHFLLRGQQVFRAA